MNRNGVMAFIIFAVIINVVAGGCEGSGGKIPGEDGRTVKAEHKSAVVHRFKRIAGLPETFGNTDRPDMIVASSGVLYVGNTANKDLFAWSINKGNVASSWTKLDDFAGSTPGLDFNLNSGTRTLLRMIPVPGGAAVFVSENTAAGLGTAGAQLGVSVFAGQTKKAVSSFEVFTGRDNVTALDFVSAAGKNNDQTIFLLTTLEIPPNHGRAIQWINLTNPLKEAQGWFTPGGGGGFSTIKFKGAPAGPGGVPPAIPAAPLNAINNNLQTLSPLPDGRVAAAKPDGLWTIAKNSVGVANGDNPEFEQVRQADVLSTNHATEWRTDDGRAPARIGAMRLINNKYLVMGFIDTGAGNGGLKYADATANPIRFTSNLNLPAIKVRKIIPDRDIAYIVADDAVYQFSNEMFSVVFDNAKLKSNTAHVDSTIKIRDTDPEPLPLTAANFKGGNLGDVPDDGAKFFDAAPHNNTWFFATDKGIYHVTTGTEYRSFEVAR